LSYCMPDIDLWIGNRHHWVLVIVNSPSLCVDNKLLVSSRRNVKNQNVESEEDAESDYDDESEEIVEDDDDSGLHKKKKHLNGNT
jgi:hypothetical protein